MYAIRSYYEYLGYALLPQAGVAIGLIFLISSDAPLAQYSAVITPVVLAGVFLSELLGPIGARYAVTKAGETSTSEPASPGTNTDEDIRNSGNTSIELAPWTWQMLTPKIV